MKRILPLVAVALSAAPAFAQANQGQAGIWPVREAGQSCTMSQSFADPEFGNHTLTIGYDASRQELSLSTTNTVAGSLPDSGELEWTIVFLDNGEEKRDDAWGERRFSYSRAGEGYRFSTRFAGEKNVRQILADLAASRSVGFLDRGRIVTAYDLTDIDRSLGRLRTCAARSVAAN